MPNSVASDKHHFQPRAFSALYPREPKAANHRPSFLIGARKVLVTTNSCKKNLTHCTILWLKWPVHELVLLIPPPPLIKVASNIRPCSKRREPKGDDKCYFFADQTSSDLKKERPVFD